MALSGTAQRSGMSSTVVYRWDHGSEMERRNPGTYGTIVGLGTTVTCEYGDSVTLEFPNGLFTMLTEQGVVTR